MEWQPFLEALGGGVPAVMIVGLAFWVVQLQRRNDTLVDKLLEVSINTTMAMNDLSRSIERGGK